MADNNYTPKEKHVGVYLPTAEEVRFNKVWGGHTFTDEEANKLLAGEEISFDSVTKAGKPYIAKGKLEQQELNGVKFWGFKLSMNSIPASWAGHTFTQEEIDILNNGGKIYVQDCVSSKSQKTFSCTLSWGEEGGRKKLIPDFGGNK